MNEVVRILMKRDGNTKEEAIARFKYCQDLLKDAIQFGDYEEAEDILASELGLEMEYIFCF